jgi:Ca-activated chloride channel homolog
MLAIAGLVAGVAWTDGRAALAQQAPVFRTGTTVVEVDVSVRNRSRRAIADLTPADFVVRDQGVVQRIDRVSFGTVPIDVTIALDVSGSVTGVLFDRLRQGVDRLMPALRPVDRLKLLLFNTTMHRAVDFTADAAAIRAATRDVPPGGATALLDAVTVALVAAAEPERRQLVIFFTDGDDSGSATTEKVLLDVAARSRATVTFVIASQLEVLFANLAGVKVTTAARAEDGIFARVARETGGAVIDGGEDPGRAFRQILDEFRSSYVLYYTPAGVDRGGFHSIEVEVLRPGAVVIARRGYFSG